MTMTPKERSLTTIQALRDAGQGGGFILSTGDQYGRETPEANLFALVEIALKCGEYDNVGRLESVGS